MAGICDQLLTTKRLDSLLRRSKRLGCCNDDLPAMDLCIGASPYVPAVAQLFSAADDELLQSITLNSNHVLHLYLPGETRLSDPYLSVLFGSSPTSVVAGSSR